MSRIVSESVTVTTAGGGAGTSTGSGTLDLRGRILSIDLNHSAGAATTDTTIAGPGTAETIWTLVNSVTDKTIRPRAVVVDNANAAITNAWDYFDVDGTVTVSLAQANIADTLTATFHVLVP